MMNGGRARALAMLVAVGCGAKVAPVPPPVASGAGPTVPIPSASHAPSPASVRAAAPSDGLYFAGPNETDSCALLGASLVCLGADSFALSVSARGRTLAPLGGASPFTLDPPSGPRGAWTLRTPPFGLALTRRDDPYLARIWDRLPARVFVRLDARKYSGARAIEDAYTSDTITMTDAMFATVESSDRGTKKCMRTVLFADPTWNRSIPLGPPPPAPAAGALGMRMFLLLHLDQDCEQPIDPRGKVGVHGALGAARLFAAADGEPLGLSLEGYMYGETFVARGVARDVVDRVLTSAATALQHQAE